MKILNKISLIASTAVILSACGGSDNTPDPIDVTPSATPTPTAEPTPSPEPTPTVEPTNTPTPEPGTVPVTSLNVSASNNNLGLPVQINVAILPENATNKALEWSVSDSSIASIDENGLLTPKQDGSVTVRVATTDGSGINASVVMMFQISGGTIVDSASGITSAIASASAGSTIFVRGGTYDFSSTIRLSGSGSETSKINLIGYPYDSDRPVFNFSAMSESSSNRGMQLSGNHWYVYGIDVTKAGDNCMHINGSNNKIEFSTFSECADTGLQIGNGASNNLVLNCDSYYNADSTLENADGFAAKLDVGTGNKFVGCRAWNNLDDGWDGYLRGADNITTTYENCWAIDNGKLKNGTVGAGDGNGFKTGGGDANGDGIKTLKHNAIFEHCIAAGNTVDGFDHNSNRGSVSILNSAAHGNGRNINFSSSNIAESLTIKNTISFGGNNSDSYNATTTDIENNSWQNGLAADASDFVSIDTELLKAPRKADGSLPDVDYLKLLSSSDLIDAGTDVGLPFNGGNPDIGAFESE